MTMVSIGADPEFFVGDQVFGNIISAHDLVPGTKDQPAYLRTDPYAGTQTIQADGTACEINVGVVWCEGSSSRTIDRAARGFSSAVDYALRHTRSSFLSKRRMTLVCTPHVEYPPEYFARLPGSALELGCEPDYNAYTGKANSVVVPKDKPTLRTAAGHIHIGWLPSHEYAHDPFEDEHYNNCRVMVLNLDRMWRQCAPDAESTSPRRLLYGDFGAFRPKPYGVEWRTPSNLWCEVDRSSYHMALNVLKMVYWTIKNGYAPDKRLPDGLIKIRGVK